MGLTRPRFSQFDTTISSISDPITVLNKSSNLANIDIGFIFNRDGGASSNVSLFWQESANTFVLAFTSNTGEITNSITNSNIAISEYANLRVNTVTATAINSTGLINTTGNLIAGNVTAPYFFGNGSQLSGIITSVTKIISGTSNVSVYENGNVTTYINNSQKIAVTSSNIHVSGSIIPTANISYDLGTTTHRFRSAYFSGNTIYLGNAILSSSGDDIVISTSGGFGVPVGTTEQRTSTLGAIRYNTTLSKFEAYDGISWNSLAYGTLTDFPSGDYGDLTATTTDAFGVPTASSFDCNSEGSISVVDLGALT